MAQNIAEEALKIARKREERKGKKLEAAFLDMVQERFDKNLAEMMEWNAIVTQGFYRLKNTKQISTNDLQDIAQKLGFFIAVQCDGKEFGLAIPEYNEENELTTAQTKLKDFRSKFARKVGEQVEMAIKFANDIFEKVQIGNFKERKEENRWTFKINIVLPCKVEEMSRYFTDKMNEIIRKAGFDDYELQISNNVIILYLEEKTK